MNSSNYMSNYTMPTPPWKSGTSMASNVQAANKFPIPPRNNDLGNSSSGIVGQKSTNYEWKKATSGSGTDTQTQNGSASYGSTAGGYGTGGGGYNTQAQGYQSQEGNTTGIGNYSNNNNFGDSNANRGGYGGTNNAPQQGVGGYNDAVGGYHNNNRQGDNTGFNSTYNQAANDSHNNSLPYNSSNRNNATEQDSRRKPVNQSPSKPLKNPLKAEDLELEKKALETDVSQDFFSKIKPLSLMQVAADVALRYARQEYYLQVLGRKTCPEKPSGSGQYTCKTCYMNFLTKEKLNSHNNGTQHKELDDLFRLKKEQARLIMEKKIAGPTPVKLEMKPLAEAEAESNLVATELELDVYILGVYESVMKPYWPVPKSTYYCRMCNYLEFSTEADFRHHNSTMDHRKREATYEEAFCLYCQRHYTDKVQLETHVSTTKHIQIKNLMERTKESAMERWHKANEVPRADAEQSDAAKAGDVIEITDDSGNATKAGTKRNAAEDENKSPAKAAKSDASKSRDDGRRSDRERSDSKASDKRSSSSKTDSRSSKADPKSSLKSDSKGGSKSKEGSKSDSKSAASSSKVWFVPVSGSICVVCHDFLKDEEEQKIHAALSKHTDNIKKFREAVAEEL